MTDTAVKAELLEAGDVLVLAGGRHMTRGGQTSYPDREVTVAEVTATHIKFTDGSGWALSNGLGPLSYAARAESQPPALTEAVAWATCQACGGSVEGWICQGCDREFREDDAGNLVFDAAPSTIQTGGDGVREAVAVVRAGLRAGYHYAQSPSSYSDPEIAFVFEQIADAEKALSALSPRSGAPTPSQLLEPGQ